MATMAWPRVAPPAGRDTGHTTLCRGCRRRRGRRRRGEVHGRRLGDGRLVLDREVGLHVIAEEHRGEVHRELADRDVVVLHRLDVAIARHGDPVLGAFQLCLQVTEVLVRLELGVPLDHDHQARQRAGKFALRCLELLQRSRIVGIDLRLRGPGASLGDADEHGLLLRGEALHRVDEIGDQVGAALVLVDDFRPCGRRGFVLHLDRVVTATRQQHCRHRQQNHMQGSHRNSLLK